MMNLLLFWQDIREKSLQELFLFVSDKRRWRWSPVLACAHTIHSETFMKTSEQNLALYWDCDELQLSPLNHLKRQCPMFNAISQFFNDIWRHPDHLLCLCLQWPFLRPDERYGFRGRSVYYVLPSIFCFTYLWKRCKNT